MDNQNDLEKKKGIDNILDKVIEKCVIDISNILDERDNEGLNFFDALDNALEFYDLEEEILINYEEEIIKSGLKNKDLSLDPKQVDIISEKIKDQIYKTYIEKFENKTR